MPSPLLRGRDVRARFGVVAKARSVGLVRLSNAIRPQPMWVNAYGRKSTRCPPQRDSPSFRVFVECVALVRVDLITDHTGDRHACALSGRSAVWSSSVSARPAAMLAMNSRRVVGTAALDAITLAILPRSSGQCFHHDRNVIAGAARPIAASARPSIRPPRERNLAPVARFGAVLAGSRRSTRDRPLPHPIWMTHR